jgi:ATP synthase protein I
MWRAREMSEKKPPPALRDLDNKLREARARRESKDRGAGARTGGMAGFGLAIRLGLDFIAGVVVGVGTGLLLDWWWGSKPWMMVLFFVIGAAAGTANVIRTASGYGGAVGFHPAGEEKDAAKKDRGKRDKK